MVRRLTTNQEIAGSIPASVNQSSSSCDDSTFALLLGFMGFMLIVTGLFGPAQEVGVLGPGPGPDPASVGREHA